METSEAIRYVNDTLVTHPEWDVTASDFTHRFQDTICVYFNLNTARASEREYFPRFNVRVPGGARSQFPIYVGDIVDRAELAYRITTAAVDVFTHEWREFLRERPDGYAPLHPHRRDGIVTWSRLNGTPVERDYGFGLA